ncbi:MAG TPA: hypothetical protein VE569_09250, partial [Acidimicrobiia bacterium]|nr:hypothetical protein [Acidimicrobiia bacterium]
PHYVKRPQWSRGQASTKRSNSSARVRASPSVNSASALATFTPGLVHAVDEHLARPGEPDAGITGIVGVLVPLNQTVV